MWIYLNSVAAAAYADFPFHLSVSDPGFNTYQRSTKHDLSTWFSSRLDTSVRQRDYTSMKTTHHITRSHNRSLTYYFSDRYPYKSLQLYQPRKGEKELQKRRVLQVSLPFEYLVQSHFNFNQIQLCNTKFNICKSNISYCRYVSIDFLPRVLILKTK